MSLTPDQQQEISRLAEWARALMAPDTQKAVRKNLPPQKQKEQLRRIADMALKLRIELESMDLAAEDQLEHAAWAGLDRKGMDLAQNTGISLRYLERAALLAAGAIEAKRGRKTGLHERWLATRVLEIVKQAGIPVTAYNESEAAEILKDAFHQAGMPRSDVREYLKGE